MKVRWLALVAGTLFWLSLIAALIMVTSCSRKEKPVPEADIVKAIQAAGVDLPLRDIALIATWVVEKQRDGYVFKEISNAQDVLRVAGPPEFYIFNITRGYFIHMVHPSNGVHGFYHFEHILGEVR